MTSPSDAASLFGTIHEDVQFKLTITDVKDDLLRVASYKGTEELSRLFTYEITVATDPDAESIAGLEQALGRDATFTITKDGKVARIVHGIVTSVLPDGTFIGKTQARAVIVLQPRLANLCHSGGFRIFQDLAFHEIVNAICQPEQIDVTYHVHGKPDKRVYCTQFNETDFDFIVRIASEEGMHFFFEHDEKKTTLVFANEADGYNEIEKDLEISFNDAIGAVDDEHVRSIRRGQAVRPGALEHHDYDFLFPKKVLVARAETQGKETTANSHKREVRDYPGRFTDKDGPGKKLAEMRLEELRSDAFTLSGTALSLRFHAGYTFKLTGHRDSGFNRKLLLTSVRMQGHVQGALNDGGGFRAAGELTIFSAVPRETPIRPDRKKKPASRLQSARVVGPKDGDPYVDDHGRVKVQFFWDRDGKFDEKSSCWMRMMTPVAHLDEGFWQAHKVGSEVVVGFIDDDIDRPMILGAVYNSVQSQLYPLPAKVAKSVWRSNSVPGNKGHNEITHDNTAGAEEIYIHAQKDRKTVVLHNHTESVGANQSVTVGANQSITVGANRSLTVGANDSTKVTAHRHEEVGKGEDVTVTQDRSHTVKDGNDALKVTTGNRTVDIDTGNHTTNAKAGTTTLETKDWKAHASQTITLTGDTSILVQQGSTTLKFEGGNVAMEVAAETKVHHGPTTVKIEPSGKVSIEAAPEVEIKCAGATLKMGGGKVDVSAPAEINLAVGGSSIKISPSSVETSATMVKSSGLALNEVTGLLVKLN